MIPLTAPGRYNAKRLNVLPMHFLKIKYEKNILIGTQAQPITKNFIVFWKLSAILLVDAPANSSRNAHEKFSKVNTPEFESVNIKRNVSNCTPNQNINTLIIAGAQRSTIHILSDFEFLCRTFTSFCFFNFYLLQSAYLMVYENVISLVTLGNS